ncbi:MAG: AbrB/MazE/SpoVT family DNA-binding domain-containing protein [Ignavibacteriae bacterium]|nr:AbrB/MazE/SpoVT family DNA-binding domain-containing protein [Ignavibacteriota bacterium]MCB9216824.1 AbrB/MazE/SpoVT family DNA-binding domain-containing protein [Ignavibacteria bacterium]
MDRASKWRSSKSVLILLTLGLSLGCLSCAKRDHDFGVGTLLISHSTYSVTIPVDKDSALILDSVGWTAGDSIIVHVEGQGVIFWELSGTHKFKDAVGTKVNSAFGYNVTPATAPLRNDIDAPCPSVLLSSPGYYTLRYDSTATEGRVWEIDG